MEGRTTSAQSSKGLALSSDSRRTQNSRFGITNRRQGGQASQKVKCACVFSKLRPCPEGKIAPGMLKTDKYD
jgi:hypothetical protein